MRKCRLLGGSDPLAVQRAASRLGNWGLVVDVAGTPKVMAEKHTTPFLEEDLEIHFLCFFLVMRYEILFLE